MHTLRGWSGEGACLLHTERVTPDPKLMIARYKEDMAIRVLCSCQALLKDVQII